MGERRFIMLPVRIICVVATLALSLISACGDNVTEPSATAGKESNPPWGLQIVDLPDDEASMARVFAQMPLAVDEVSLVESTADAVSYEGEGGRFLSIRVVRVSDVPAGPSGEKLTPAGFMELMLGGEIESVEASQVDATSSLIYIVGTSFGDDELLHAAFWADPATDWVFAAVGDTQEARTELVHAFIDACAASS